MSATAFNRRRREIASQEHAPKTIIIENSALYAMTIRELRETAKDKAVTGYSNMNKQQLIEALSK